MGHALVEYDPEASKKLKITVKKAASGQTVYYEVKNRIGPDEFIYVDFTLNPVLNKINP